MNNNDLDRLTAQAQKRGQPYRILIVDDERWVRDVFRDFCDLTDAFEVELASDGIQAVEMAKARQYDLITLDLIMPEMSGIEALTKIKESSPRIPIMVITGNATDKLVNEAGVLGACRVMFKPIQLKDFISELTAALT